MLNFFVSLLLISTAATASDTESDICDKLDRCQAPDPPPGEFPETNEELRKICVPAIKHMECIFENEAPCWDIPPETLELRRNTFDALREICSEDTLLHAAIVDNLKCFKKLIEENGRECFGRETADEILQASEALIEEGLIPLTENENDTFSIHTCIEMMSFFACHSLVVEKSCGNVAMDAYVEVVQKAGPGALEQCENFFHLIPALIRLRRAEEGNDTKMNKVFRK